MNSPLKAPKLPKWPASRFTPPALPRLKKRPAPAPAPTVQATHQRAVACVRDVLILRDGRCRAILEVTGLSLASLPDTDQETVLAGLLRLFSGLTHPVQLLVRTEAVDLEAHAAEVEAATAGGAARLASLAADYAAYVRSLAWTSSLLRRRCLVVIPADPGLSWVGARHQLATRCADLLQAFARVRMPARRLVSRELHRLQVDIWRPGAPVAPWDAEEVAAPVGWATAVHDSLARTGNLDAAVSVLVPATRETVGSKVHDALPRPLRRLVRRWEHRLSAEDAEAARALWTSASTFVDRTAPAAAGHTPLSFRLTDSDREATRTLRVTNWPRWTVLAWLTPLVTLDDTVDVSLHLVPTDLKKALTGVNRRLMWLQASRIKNAESGRPDDPELLAGVADLQRIQSDLSVSGERLWDAALYVHLRARGDHAERALGNAREGLQARVEAAVLRTAAETHVAAYQQPEGFKAVEPLCDDPLGATRTIDTRTVARAIPFVVGSETGRGFLLAIDRMASGPVLYDPFDPAAFNANLTLIAQSGSGKSYTTKLIASRARYLGADVLIVDPEREYVRLCAAHGGQYVRFSLNGGSHINPFDVPPPDVDEDTGAPIDPIREKAADVAALVATMLRGDGPALDPDQRAAIDRGVMGAYRDAGIVPGEADTWDRTPPVLGDLHRQLLDGQSPASLTMAARLEPWITGSYAGILDRQTDVALASPFVVFDVRDVGPELRAVVMHAITGYIWRQVRRERKRRLLVVDEAASVLATPEGARFLQEMSRRARKYWLGLVTAVQELRHLDDSPAGKDVLTNATTKLILGHGADKIGAVVEAFGLSETERTDLLAADKGEGLLIGRASRRFIRVAASPEEHRLVTTRPDEIAAIEAEERAATQAGAGKAA